MILRKWFGHQCHPITRNSHSILTILLIFQVFSTVDAKYVSVAYFKPWAQFCIIRHYSPGYAELTIGGKGIGYKNILVLFDSGSSYTYLNSQAYQAFISSVSSKLLLNVCWHYSTGRIPEKSWYESFVSAITFLFSDILNSLLISFLLNVLKYLPYKNYLRAFDCQGKKKKMGYYFLENSFSCGPDQKAWCLKGDN